MESSVARPCWMAEVLCHTVCGARECFSWQNVPHCLSGRHAALVEDALPGLEKFCERLFAGRVRAPDCFAEQSCYGRNVGCRPTWPADAQGRISPRLTCCSSKADEMLAPCQNGRLTNRLNSCWFARQLLAPPPCPAMATEAAKMFA